MYKLVMRIKRTDGTIETIDVTGKIGFNQARFDGAKKGTKAAGRGDVLDLTQTETTSNILELRARYRNLNNEGGDGYIPEGSYFTNLPEYEEYTKESVIK